jgi:hypothetical protein
MPAAEAASQNPQPVAGQAQINGLEIAGLVQNADTQGGAVKTGQATAQTPPTSGTIQNNAAQAQALTSNAVLNATVQNNTAIRGAGQSGTGIETTAQGGVTETIVSPIGQPTEQPAGGAQAAQAVQSQNSVQTQANAAAPTETVVRVDAQGALQSTAQTEGAAADGQAQGAPQVSQALSMGADAKTIIQPFMNETAAAEQGHNADSGINDENKGFLQYNSVPENIGTSNTKEGDIAQKALRMFVLTDDVENLAGHIGKAVREMPDQLKELKLLAEDADNIVREAVSSKLDQIEKQMSLMSEVKRFDCYQIPLQTGTQQQTTAELFVYRYRGGKKAVDPDNILILLGLDTQHMGRVETLVKTSGKNLNIEFNLEDMRLGDEMETEAGLLKEAVQQAGYNFSGVSVKQLNARTTVLNAEERFDKEADGSAGNLDVRI